MGIWKRTARASVRTWLLAGAMLLAVPANGLAWTVQSTPDPSGSTESKLNSISCPNGEQCMAVGFYKNSKGTIETLAQHMVGTYSYELPPNPTEEKPELIAVSCTSTEYCVAVGRYTDSSGFAQAMAEEFYKGKWTLMSVPAPTGAYMTEIGGVSCAEYQKCTAVGDDHDSSGKHDLAEQLSGTTWKAEVPSGPAGAGYLALTGVSCVKVGECIAVGTNRNSSNEEVPQADEYTGSWKAMAPAQTPLGATNVWFTRISCVKFSECVGIGFYTNTKSEVVPYGEEWTGTWEMLTPATPSTVTELYGISCPTAIKECFSVGKEVKSGVSEALGEELTAPNKWSVLTMGVPSGAKATDLQEVSCSLTQCFTVGFYINKAGETVTLAE